MAALLAARAMDGWSVWEKSIWLWLEAETGKGTLNPGIYEGVGRPGMLAEELRRCNIF